MTTDTIDPSQGGIDLDTIEARERAATPGPWERGTPWRYAGVVLDEAGSVVGPERGTRCGACRLGEPVWAGLMDVNGTVMPAHRHRNPEPDAEDFAHHVSSAEGGRITGNYDYEIGGILVPEDTEFVAHSREDIPALVTEVRQLRASMEHLKGDFRKQIRHAEVAMVEAERGRLRERLAAAELVCIGYSSLGARHDGDREKATYELWLEWTGLTTIDHNDYRALLPDARIAELARRRDAKRADTLARLAWPEGEVPDDDA